MLRTLENILGYRIVASDGEIGKVHDFFIDDSLWRLRYVVAETGNWMSRRHVLISLTALGEIRSDQREFHVNLTCEQVRNAPDIDTDKPVSRQQEMMMNAHYGWPAYWAPEALIVPEPILALLNRRKEIEGDAHLRSFREISSYGVKHGDDRVGKVEDFVIEDADWSLMRLVVTEGGWLDGRRVALSSSHITEISWINRRICVDLTKSDLTRRPPFDYGYPVNREERVMYFDYCGRPAEPMRWSEHVPA